MKKRLVAPDLWQFALQRPDVLNVYLAGDVLIDAGMPSTSRQLIGALKAHQVGAHALTHAHFDHQGGSHAVCESFGVPMWCGAGDREAAETGDWTRLLPRPDGWMARLAHRLAGPGHPVARVLADGDRVGDFTVIETPGHTPGHLAFWRERDRILILGDVLFHRNPATRRSGLREPFGFATRDPAVNRESARRLAALEPLVVCFGHGEPLTDVARFQEFVSSLES
ncbi:MAG: MBL fold metallo-hydrolase [Gemmatimonadetes bacterium]|nr:MBL fold metallo-hydrolase [Gemmatimonadota bacterium]